MTTGTITLPQQQLEIRSFVTRVYGWMFFALMLTGLVAMQIAASPAAVRFIAGTPALFFGLVIAELALVAALSFLVGRMSAATATIVFVIYSALNGVTLSMIFLVYTAASIAFTFFVTAGTFGLMAAYGYFTKRDLTSVGNILIMALIGLILASIVNIFWTSSTLYWIITYAGVLIFVGLTAYDAQKIKQMAMSGIGETEEGRKYAIIGALALYLDFINLFLMLLRLLGSRRD